MIGTSREQELTNRIKTIIPEDKRLRYETLNSKRSAEEISDEEYSELLDLTEIMGDLNADRVELIAELAAEKHVPLAEVAKTFSGTQRRG